MGRMYHVSISGNDTWDGSLQKPFRTISKAAKLALAGDTVIVHEGEYREWVKPENGGESKFNRIVYKAAEGEKVVIKGSERINNWEHMTGTVWKVEIPNTFFGDYNPYEEVIGGDWYLEPKAFNVHTGEVYLNGKSFYEAKSIEEVMSPTMRTIGYNPDWTGHQEEILYPEDSIYQWYGEVDEEITTIYANFQGTDPNKEITEINVRKSCFYPIETGRNYITVQGFEMAQAATPWAPPTAEQYGLIGVNWSKGWIIENNIIHDSKCSGISIGKEKTTGHNLSTKTNRKPGYQYQLESVFQAKRLGWSKETIGSHIIRNNIIYDCGQTGIVGHLGCVFSEIHKNEIYNIGVKHEFFGHEIAGIKLHAAIDVQIIQNNIHDCTLGTWLDWQAQGTRVSKNIYYNNNRDLFIEVTHGPHIVDNNIFASEYNLDNLGQGGAYIHNLFCGTMRREKVLDRATPYHYSHSTDIAGYAFTRSGDDRVYQNIYVGGSKSYIEESISGTKGYDGFTTSITEYVGETTKNGSCDHRTYFLVEQPVFINKNVYLNGATSFEKEKVKVLTDFDPEFKIDIKDDETYIEINIPKEVFGVSTDIISTETLGSVRIVEAIYDNPIGESIIFDSDYLDKEHKENSVVGPFSNLKLGLNRIKVWG